MKSITGIMLVGLMLSFAVQGASFDCGKAKTKVEKLICSHDEIKELDGALAKVYRRVVLKQPQHAARIRLKQHEWLKSRESCLAVRYQAKADRDEIDLCRSSTAVSPDRANQCAQQQCLMTVYRTRIAELYAGLGEHWRHKSWEVGKGDIVNGAKYPLCTAFLKNLNSHYKADHISEWTFNPAIKSLALPKWEKVDPKANLDLIEETLTWSNLFKPDETRWPILKPEVLSRIDQDLLAMKQTRIRLANDESPVLLVSIDFGSVARITAPSGETDSIGGRYFRVIDESSRKLDKRYDYLPYADGVFFHEGKAYLVRKYFGHGTLDIEEPFSARGGYEKGSITVCVFEYLGE